MRGDKTWSYKWNFAYKTPLEARDVLFTYKTPGSYTRAIRPPRGLISETGGLISEYIFHEGSYKWANFLWGVF